MVNRFAFRAILIPSNIENNPEKAEKIARLCQHCQNVPCMQACPADIDIPNFIRRIEAGNFNGAAKAIRETNPFAEICGIICSPSNFCEKECYRKTFADKPVPIQELHKWIASYAGKNGWADYYSEPNGKKVAIIGAGPSGLTCAYYLARLGYKVDLYEKNDKIGGVLLEYIENGRLSDDIFQREANQIISRNINLIVNWELSGKDQLNELIRNYNSVYLTAPSKLNLEELNTSQEFATGGRWYSSNPEDYAIVESVRNSRHAALKIHNFK